ncbi:MAG: LptF/LptG family permease [Bacteroidetes bacterium]|nr:LptF/LptG family permease [Bacteroidota bacterium]
MKILDWYIIKKFLSTFFFSILLFIVITLVIDISEKTDDFVKSHLSASTIFTQYYLGFIPHMTAMLFPLFVFIAVIFFTSKMAAHSENIAILASGTTFNRWLRPYFIGGTFLAAVLWVSSMFIIPNANKKRTAFETRYIDANSSYEKTMSITNGRGSSMYIKIDSFSYAVINNYDTASLSSSGCTIFRITKDKVYESLQADKLYWDKKTKKWALSNVYKRNIDTIKETLTQLPNFNLATDVTPQDLLRGKYTKDILTSPQLKRTINLEQQKGAENVNELMVEYGRRSATPVSVIILTLLGAIVAGRKIRGGSGANLALGFITAALFILADKFSTIFSTKGNLHPYIAVWIPNVIFSFVVLYLYKKAPK